MNNFGEKVAFIWSVADLLRDAFKRSKYPDVILPLPSCAGSTACWSRPRTGYWPPTPGSRTSWRTSPRNSARRRGSPSTTRRRTTSSRCCGDAKNLAANLRAYINGFSDNMREVVEKFDFDNTIAKLDEAGLLFLVTGAVQEHRPAPRQGVEPRNGLRLRGTDPQVQRGDGREPRRTLHAP